MDVPCLFTKTVLTVRLRLGPGLIVVLHFDHGVLQLGRLTRSRLSSEQRENKTERVREEIESEPGPEAKRPLLTVPCVVSRPESEDGSASLHRRVSWLDTLDSAASPGGVSRSHNDKVMDQLQEGGRSNYKTTAVFIFFNALGGCCRLIMLKKS